MSKKAITCNTAPSAIGTYSQAISVGNLVFISGQIPLNYKDMNVIEGSFEEQVETVINNIKNIASDAECTLNDCVKFTVYLKDIENFASVNAVMDKHLEKLSGQIPLNYKDMNVIEGSFEEQVETVINNIKNIASDAECTLNDCVKFTVYLKDIENFASVNAVMDKHLEKPYPARAAVEVSRLPKDVEVEIDAILYKK